MSKDFLYGRHAVLHALQNPRRALLALYVQKELPPQETLSTIRQTATARGVEIKEIKRFALERKFSVTGKAHQGVVLIAADYPHVDWADWINNPKGTPFILVLDHIQDPHNLGAILRSAELAGVDGVIIPKDRAVAVTNTVVKTSAGATELVPIDQVSNINQTIDELKKTGLRVIGLETGGDQTIYDINLTLPTALVVGNENTGLSKLTARKCDALAEIPMQGKLASLNVSVATSIALFEAVRQRHVHP